MRIDDNCYRVYYIMNDDSVELLPFNSMFLALRDAYYWIKNIRCKEVVIFHHSECVAIIRK